jgi:hypothetical protein
VVNTSFLRYGLSGDIIGLLLRSVLTSHTGDTPEDARGGLDNAVHTVVNMVPEDKKRDYEYIGKGQLGLAAGAVHTTARELTHMMYTLAEFPEHIDILREEIRDVFGEGKVRKGMLDDMNRLVKKRTQNKRYLSPVRK